MKQPQAPYGAAPPSRPRTIRVYDHVWEKARRRADAEGITMSRLCAMIIQGYGDGLVDMPQINVQYTQPRDAEQKSA